VIFATDLVRGGGVGGRMLQRYQGWRGKKGREWEGEEEEGGWDDRKRKKKT